MLRLFFLLIMLISFSIAKNTNIENFEILKPSICHMSFKECMNDCEQYNKEELLNKCFFECESSYDKCSEDEETKNLNETKTIESFYKGLQWQAILKI